MDMFFSGMNPAEKVAKFAELGYKAVELWCWWEYDIAELAAALRKNDVELAAICTKFVSLVTPETREEYIDGLREAVDACGKLSCPTIISQVGDELTGVSREDQRRSLIDGLKAVVPILEAAGKTLVVEPLNILVDHKGYFLARSDEAAEILNAVGSDNVKMLFDVYHQQITEGNLINNINKHKHLIGHFHIADNPGRKQPGTGEINYRNVFKALQESGCDKFIGLEFSPSDDSAIVLENFANEYVLRRC